MTKQQMKEQFFEIVCSDETKNYERRLLNLMCENRITSGCYIVENLHDDYHYKKLLNTDVKRLSKWKINYLLEQVKERIEKIKKFVEEQENLPFEETQMQKLIKENKIQSLD